MTPGGVTDVTPMQRNSTSVGHDPLGGLEVAGSKVTGSEVTGSEVTMRSLCRLEVARLKVAGSVKGHRVGGRDPFCGLQVAESKGTGSVRGHRVGGHDPLALPVRGRAVKDHRVGGHRVGDRDPFCGLQVEESKVTGSEVTGSEVTIRSADAPTRACTRGLTSDCRRSSSAPVTWSCFIRLSGEDHILTPSREND